MFDNKCGFAHYCRVMAVSLVLVSLVGCVGGAQTVKPDYRFKESERKGLGMLSVAVDDRCGKSVPVVHYRAADSSSGKSRKLVLDKESKGAASDYPQGWFFIQEEDAGDFIFTHVSYGKEVQTVISRVPVTFTNGRVTYLGALQVSIPKCEQVEVMVVDQSQRDFSVFENHMKYFKSKYVMKALIRGR